jgi:hypothetical protein
MFAYIPANVGKKTRAELIVDGDSFEDNDHE